MVPYLGAYTAARCSERKKMPCYRKIRTLPLRRLHHGLEARSWKCQPLSSERGLLRSESTLTSSRQHCQDLNVTISVGAAAHCFSNVTEGRRGKCHTTFQLPQSQLYRVLSELECNVLPKKGCMFGIIVWEMVCSLNGIFM